jgi:hypothetical protein
MVENAVKSTVAAMVRASCGAWRGHRNSLLITAAHRLVAVANRRGSSTDHGAINMAAASGGGEEEASAAQLVCAYLRAHRDWSACQIIKAKDLSLWAVVGFDPLQARRRTALVLPLHKLLSVEAAAQLSTQMGESENEILIAAVDSDSTMTFYSMSAGIPQQAVASDLRRRGRGGEARDSGDEWADEAAEVDALSEAEAVGDLVGEGRDAD